MLSGPAAGPSGGVVAWTVAALVLIVAGCSVDDRRLRTVDLLDSSVGDAATNEAGPAAAPDGGTPSLGPNCLSCSFIPIGTAVWQPASAVVATNPDPGGDIMTALQAPLAPNHAWYPAEALFGPGQPHQGDYGDEVTGLLTAARIIPNQTVEATALPQTPNILLIITLVPGPGELLGASADFDFGRVIDNGAFPIHATADLLQNGAFLGAHQELSIPSEAQFGFPVTDAGSSHLLVIFGQDGAAIPGTIGAPNTYSWLIIIIDAHGDGWELQIPFQVNL